MAVERNPRWLKKLEAPPGFEPGIEVLQTSALPLGDGADRNSRLGLGGGEAHLRGCAPRRATFAWPANRNSRSRWHARAKVGAGNGIRTRDFDLGKVALYH